MMAQPPATLYALAMPRLPLPLLPKPVLFETPESRAPDGGTCLFLRTEDGLQIRAAIWPAPGGHARGTVVVAPGRAEFIEKYYAVIASLRDRGFAVATLDWRGQGGSARELANPRKGHVDDFLLYERDLKALTDHLAAIAAPQPWFGLGHSMAGAVFLAAARRGELPFARMVLSAPLIDLHGLRYPRGARALAETLDFAGLGASFIPGGGGTASLTRPFANNPLTSDAVRYGQAAEFLAQESRLGIGDPTIGWLNAAFRAMRPFEDIEFPRRLVLPALIVAAGADTIVSTPAAERFGARLKAGQTLVIPRARHEILFERDSLRDQFWAAFDTFIPGTALADRPAGRSAAA